jgi:hypothetical protein
VGAPSDIAVIVPVMTIVGDTDEERHNERELVRASMSFYGSTPNYAFIWDEAGFEWTTARTREKQKAGDFKGMAPQITDEHIATFATESTWDGLANALIEKYEGIATRIVLCNALGDHERFERYGAAARSMRALRDRKILVSHGRTKRDTSEIDVGRGGLRRNEPMADHHNEHGQHPVDVGRRHALRCCVAVVLCRATPTSSITGHTRPLVHSGYPRPGIAAGPRASRSHFAHPFCRYRTRMVMESVMKRRVTEGRTTR